MELSDFEFDPINLFRLDLDNKVTTYQQPFRPSFIEMLNKIQDMNLTVRKDLILSRELITFEPLGDSNETFPPTTELQKEAYWVVTSGMRGLRQKTDDSNTFLRSQNDAPFSPFLIIMILAVVLGLCSTAVILYQIWRVENILGSILSIYAHLQIDNIKQVHFQCCLYLEELIRGSFIEQISLT